jgi:hypothetical protein
MKKFIPLAMIMFAVLFNYTILRDTKDTLVVNAAGAGAITFLKSYCVTPMAILFVIFYAKLTNILNRENVFMQLFFVCIKATRSGQFISSKLKLKTLILLHFRIVEERADATNVNNWHWYLDFEWVIFIVFLLQKEFFLHVGHMCINRFLCIGLHSGIDGSVDF